MKQRVLKPTLLLMIGIGISIIEIMGYFPLAQGWFVGICSISYLWIAGLIAMVFTIYSYGGLLLAVKYAVIMATTSLCISQYKKLGESYNPYISGTIGAVIYGALELTDWALNGMFTVELYGLLPSIMLTWSTSIIFTYIIMKIMWKLPIKTSEAIENRRQQLIKNDRMIKTSYGLKNIADKIHKMSGMEWETEPAISENVENEIQNEICNGCEKSRIQYLERAKINYVWHNKMIETREAMAIQLKEMANIMEYYTKPLYNEKNKIFGMENLIKNKLAEKKIAIRKINIYENLKGITHVFLIGKNKRKSGVKIEIIEKTISQALGKNMILQEPRIDEFTEEFREYCFVEDVNFITISGVIGKTRDDEKYSGDNYTYMELKSGSSFMSICDGMGSGKKAEYYSELIIDLLEQLLESDFEETTSLKLINSVLLAGNQWQEPAALDMALIDKYSGNCQFLKMGAACTYIKRGNWVECIRSTSLPMGVLEDVDMETITKKLYDGDFVIMVSDGIVDSLQCTDREEAMGRIIMDIHTSSPREMSAEILKRALILSKGEVKDDMTIISTGIWEKI